MNEDVTPKAELCSEVKCAEYRDELECRVQDLEAKVRESNRLIDEFKQFAESVRCDSNCGNPYGPQSEHFPHCSVRRAQSILSKSQKRNETSRIGEKPRTPGFCACGWYIGHAGECTKRVDGGQNA